MLFSGGKRRKNGFTVVELVIVIAVLAILAAVLIPTFTSIVKKSRHSSDISTATNVNRLLLVDYTCSESDPEYDEIAATVTKGGYSMPLLPELDGYSYYYVPDKNVIVLYNEDEGTVEYPAKFSELTKSDDWINLSEKAEEKPEDKPDDDTPDVPVEEEYVLLNGKSFNTAIKSISGDVTRIVFGKTDDHKGKVTSEPVKVSSKGTVNAYLNGTEIYVLCNGVMEVPQDFSGAFFGLGKLTAVEFDSFDTSQVTNMSNMFGSCGRIKQLDLSSFNTQNVTNTAGMFKECTNIEKIEVTTADREWNMSKVTTDTSKEMFYGCEKLRNYKTDSDDWLARFIDDIIGFFVSRDVSFANTGKNGYLTEKQL